MSILATYLGMLALYFLPRWIWWRWFDPYNPRWVRRRPSFHFPAGTAQPPGYWRKMDNNYSWTVPAGKWITRDRPPPR